MTNKRPGAFICHSSKDKKRFVLDFAKRLLNRGIDAWVDKWEMRIGDSLIRGIFDEGIDKHDSFVIILSKNSIGSKWVKQELDIAAVKRIKEQTKILPIIIDDNVKIPPVLIATVWKKIKDLNSYDEEFNDIVNAIWGVSEKPPVGEPPKYAIEIATIGDLSQIDSIILKLIVENLLETGTWTRLISGANLESIWKENEISKEQVVETLEILDGEAYISMGLTTEGWFGSHFKVANDAIREYAENYVEDFDKKVLTVISKIINENIMRSDVLAEQSSLHPIVVSSLIEEWDENDYIKFTNSFGGDGVISFQLLSASGKRYFNEMLIQ
ncbi:MAG: toll/interleukin-1 receptor domain-containing protein [Nitrosopumilus sp.]